MYVCDNILWVHKRHNCWNIFDPVVPLIISVTCSDFPLSFNFSFIKSNNIFINYCSDFFFTENNWETNNYSRRQNYKTGIEINQKKCSINKWSLRIRSIAFKIKIESSKVKCLWTFSIFRNSKFLSKCRNHKNLHSEK